MSVINDRLEEACSFVRDLCWRQGSATGLHTAVVLGSGLGSPGDHAAAHGGLAVPYTSIPGLPQSAVAGHAGRLVIGGDQLQGVAFLQGRVHLYEGHSLRKVTFATAMLAALGVRRLILTNAAGGISPTFAPGDLMLIDGHLSFTEVSIRQQQWTRCSPGALWNARLRNLAAQIPSKLNVHQGVYAMMSGPCYETPAEIRMLRTLGADAVGMSTVPEAIFAAQHQIDVLGVSCITNAASGLTSSPLDHSEVSTVASGIDGPFTDWLLKLLNVARD